MSSSVTNWKQALESLPSTPEKIPAFFFAHGSPMLAFPASAASTLGGEMAAYHGPNGPLAKFLAGFGPALLKKYKPKGIVVFSAHWETMGERLVSDYAENPLLMDYYGFAPEEFNSYFRTVLDAVSAGPFYHAYVKLPNINTPLSDYIRYNRKLYPFLHNVLGALDGTHINCFTSAADRHASRDRKGGVTQNCLAVCSFEFRFLYFASGFEGSAADATMYMQARLFDFMIPEGKYYLADAGFALCDTLLVPYRNVRYHLQEWGRANIRPINKEELFNLRHAQARNVIERIFGVLKNRWDILNRAPQFSMSIQAKIPPGLAAVHNFIMDYDEEDLQHMLDGLEEVEGISVGEAGEGAIPPEERERASDLRDQIAIQMWNSYQQYLHDHPELLEENFVAETY